MAKIKTDQTTSNAQANDVDKDESAAVAVDAASNDESTSAESEGNVSSADSGNLKAVVTTVSGVASVGLDRVSLGASHAVAEATKVAEAAGDNVTHAALHSVHVAMTEFANRVNDALKSVEGEAAELLQGIKNLF
ncbi:hypothetical protein ACO0K2_17810 [Undibacterium sp. MH2W]|uniref:hypothetical protein n=1 Tax=Undibacterium sp. MH2W TaxID=3413044 RepID=UPI003BF407B7